MDATRLADELRSEQEHSAQIEKMRKNLEITIKELHVPVEEAESSGTKGGRKTIAKLEQRVRTNTMHLSDISYIFYKLNILYSCIETKNGNRIVYQKIYSIKTQLVLLSGIHSTIINCHFILNRSVNWRANWTTNNAVMLRPRRTHVRLTAG